MEVPESVQQFLHKLLGEREYFTISGGPRRGGEQGGEAQWVLIARSSDPLSDHARQLLNDNAGDLMELFVGIALGRRVCESTQQWEAIKILIDKIVPDPEEGEFTEGDPDEE